MKGLTKEALLKILELKNYDFYLESDIDYIFKTFGDDYYINRENNTWELCKKNDDFHI